MFPLALFLFSIPFAFFPVSKELLTVWICTILGTKWMVFGMFSWVETTTTGRKLARGIHSKTTQSKQEQATPEDDSDGNPERCSACGFNYSIMTETDVKQHEKYCPYKEGNGLTPQRENRRASTNEE